eukprot:TRINITY_DN9294_c0_g1_i8.p1 TRINITY_DN9294_c0_g1~~TRINITY_DN9294_c0_g1_i8.p1  ORF type:complete len:503 (+),score=40.30 TRINITY_DN9294_c0_g1_i8:743-2251(+)
MEIKSRVFQALDQTLASGEFKFYDVQRSYPNRNLRNPFFLFEQVASCLGDALKIFTDFLDLDLVKIDSYPHFSHARRQRVYATNLRNHKQILDWVVEKRQLKQVLNWPMKKDFPVWTNSVFKIVPLKTILASTNCLVKKEDVEIAIRILDSFEQQSGPQIEQEIKQFMPEDVLNKMQKMNLVPNVNNTLTFLTAEQKEELMGYPIAYTNIFNKHQIGCTQNKRLRNNTLSIQENLENAGDIYNQHSQILDTTQQQQITNQINHITNVGSQKVPDMNERFGKNKNKQSGGHKKTSCSIENVQSEFSVCNGCHRGRIKNGKCEIAVIEKDIKFSTPSKYNDARAEAIGKSFQVDTVAYLLHPLKLHVQKQVNVLSLFDGIGGTAVALYKLKIPVRKYYSAEINPFAKEICRKFVEDKLRQISPFCEFVDVGCIKNVNQSNFLNGLVGSEKSDLVIGGPPCSNLSGANRHRGDAGRTGVTRRSSCLFFDFAEILEHLRHLYNKVQ